jgi:hypothetical protein
MQADKAQRLLEYVVKSLAGELGTSTLGSEYYYQSLPLAAIDAVFSARAKYPSVQNVIQRYCKLYGLSAFRPRTGQLPSSDSQETVSSPVLSGRRVAPRQPLCIKCGGWFQICVAT